MSAARPRQRFEGVIGTTPEESTPWWPPVPTPPAGSPDVVVILLDDVGFAQLGCYGSDIETPVMDGLAAGGVRYVNFHTVALCSPTRSCLLSGRNHHSNGMAGVVQFATGFPGYNVVVPRENGFVSEVLRDAGYSTYMLGKWHVTPDDEMSMAGPFDRWPLRRGFDRFYGFHQGHTHQWNPGSLIYDNHFIEPPAREGYHLTEDLTDRAIEFVRDAHVARPDKPFLLYVGYGACHAPHHAPPEYIERYRGRFEAGWDVAREETLRRQKELGLFDASVELPPPNPEVKSWDDLSADEQRLFARMQEAFAGSMTHTDDQIGRLVDFLKEVGRFENTLFILLSDNGASMEGGQHGTVNEYREYNDVAVHLEENLAAIDELGGPSTWNHYPLGWGAAGNTPFRRWKRYSYQGGVADPCIMHWPAGMAARGEIRRQYCHVIDLMPTILEALQVEPPDEIDGVTQSPIEGTSMAYTFGDADAPTRKVTQYYEMLGTRAIWHRGWKALTTHEPLSGTGNFQDDVWELYHTDEDPNETRNLAEERPELLRSLIEMWWVEAGKYNVLPLDDRGYERFNDPRPRTGGERAEYVYLPRAAPVFERAAVDIVNRSYEISAEVVLPEGGAEGVLIARGSRFGGYSLYVKDGTVSYVHNLAGATEYRVSAPIELPPGPATFGVRFTKTAHRQGDAALLINGTEVAREHFPHTLSLLPTDQGLTCGEDRGLTVTDAYTGPFTFTGTIKRVVVTVEDDRDEQDVGPGGDPLMAQQ